MKYSISISFVLLDIDECLSSSHACDVTANCTNTDGSHNCTCKEGYTGDGQSCHGMITALDLENTKKEKSDVCFCRVTFWQFIFVFRCQ